MDDGKRDFFVFDEYSFRGSAIKAIIEKFGLASSVVLADMRSDTAFIDILIDENSHDASGRLPIGVYVAGGRALSDPDVVSDLSAIRARSPMLRLIALTDRCRRDDIEVAIDLGLNGVIPGHFTETVAAAAFRFIICGGDHFPHSFDGPSQKPQAASYKVITLESEAIEVADEVVGVSLAPSGDEIGESFLTSRQQDVLDALREGHSNKLIARKLGISEATVKIHVRQLMKKFGAENRTQVVVRAGDIDAYGGRKSVLLAY